MRDLVLLLAAEAGLAAFLDVNGNELKQPVSSHRDKRLSVRRQFSLFKRKRQEMEDKKFAMPISNPLFHESESELGKKTRLNSVGEECLEEDVNEANRLIASRGQQWLLNPEYEEFIKRCLESIGGVPVETLMQGQAESTLRTLREVVGISGSAEMPSSRTAIDTEIQAHWKEIVESKILMKKLVSVPNYMALRYAAGVEDATRILLENGGLVALIHNKNSVATHQLVQSLTALMWRPLSQLLSLARPLHGDVQRADTAVYRPKYLEDVKFLWGKDPKFAAHFKRAIVGRVEAQLEMMRRKQNANKKILGRLSEYRKYFFSMCDEFKANIHVYEPPFDLINLADKDKLAVLVGHQCAQDLLRKRAVVAINKLLEFSAKKCGSTHGCKFAQKVAYIPTSTDLVFQCEKIVYDLRDYPEIFDPKTADYLSFFLGPSIAHAVAKDGPDKKITVEGVDRKKVEVAIWDAFITPRDSAREMFDNVMNDQMQVVAAEKAHFVKAEKHHPIIEELTD